jgi:hypothetical protein
LLGARASGGIRSPFREHSINTDKRLARVSGRFALMIQYADVRRYHGGRDS